MSEHNCPSCQSDYTAQIGALPDLALTQHECIVCKYVWFVYEPEEETTMPDLVTQIQRLYDREINASIEWFWDSGFHVRLGDAVNGWKTERRFWDFTEALAWLVEQAEKYWPQGGQS